MCKLIDRLIKIEVLHKRLGENCYIDTTKGYIYILVEELNAEKKQFLSDNLILRDKTMNSQKYVRYLLPCGVRLV